VTVRASVSAEEAVSRIRDGDVVMVGGFGLGGAPLTLIDALVESSSARDLTVVSNNVGEAGRGLGKLLREGRIRKAIASYFTSNPEAVAAAQAGEIDYELLPQGTFAEAIRAAGAGLGGFYTPVVYAARADAHGNLWYRRTARNFNPAMATAATYCAAEAGEIVAIGQLEAENVHTPHLYVDALVPSHG
jgi:acyl CoA:acetate/3-ketoacid CoA transferase alpha subunit